jgi:hypothetical protein
MGIDSVWPVAYIIYHKPGMGIIESWYELDQRTDMTGAKNTGCSLHMNAELTGAQLKCAIIASDLRCVHPNAIPV